MNSDQMINHIASAVRAEMARQGMSQVDLADLLLLPQQAVSPRLRGERSFRAEEIVMVAHWLEVLVTDLLPVLVPAQRRGATK